MTSIGWQTECVAAIHAARAAGDILVEQMGRVSVQYKGRNDLVTQADHAAQEAIRRSLARQFPDDAFLGEEGAGAWQPTKRRRWIVDPLDGTTNYVHGFPFFCVSIALEFEGRLVLGVVVDPIRGECFTAIQGHGTCRNGIAVHASRTASLADALVGAGLPAEPALRPESIGAMVHLTRCCQSFRRIGSAALTLAYVAAGRMDAFYAHQLRPWDAAAGVLMVREAGGHVSNLDQSPFDLGTPDLIASNGLIHAELAQAIAVAVGQPVE